MTNNDPAANAAPAPADEVDWTDVDWNAVYDTARAHMEKAQGYYNHNVRVDLPDGPVVVRIPIPNAQQMDLRLWPEQDVLRAIAPYILPAPRVLHTSTNPAYQIHQFITGNVLDAIAPRCTPVPTHVPGEVIALLSELHRVPRQALPPTPNGWPQDGDSAGFAARLAAVTQGVLIRHGEDFAPLYERLNVPPDPLAAVLDGLSRLRQRPAGCVHADIHRKNMIVDSGRTVFLDWELALWGDPVYDLAVHFHKMSYQPAEQQAVLDGWLALLPTAATTGWEDDVPAYLAHEQVKSVVVDTVRYSQQFAADPNSQLRRHLSQQLTGKLRNARQHWRIEEPLDPDEVYEALYWSTSWQSKP